MTWHDVCREQNRWVKNELELYYLFTHFHNGPLQLYKRPMILPPLLHILKTATAPPTSAATPKDATPIDAAIPGTTVDVGAAPVEVAEAVGSEEEEGESDAGIRTLSQIIHVSNHSFNRQTRNKLTHQ